jgi:hypothetical protein
LIDGVRQIARDQLVARSLLSLGEDLVGPLVETLGPDLVSGLLNSTLKRDGTSAS